ncbi:MAG TPA: LLM class flavin-dependent oxidoreductase, partial [Acidimicrobiales bacterium]|nr:LLM class flavin-dependent oxidoreductase [Acidimicrobiales bacterium]
MKIRIGISLGVGATTDMEALGQLVDDLDELDFDSLWLPEILSIPALDPMVALAFAAAHNPRLKLGTTMLLPGRNPVRLA